MTLSRLTREPLEGLADRFGDATLGTANDQGIVVPNIPAGHCKDSGTPAADAPGIRLDRHGAREDTATTQMPAPEMDAQDRAAPERVTEDEPNRGLRQLLCPCLLHVPLPISVPLPVEPGSTLTSRPRREPTQQSFILAARRI